MRINSFTPHYFNLNWSAELVKKTYRSLAVEFHPDRAHASVRDRYNRILQDVNAEHDIVKKYANQAVNSRDDIQSVYQITGQHSVDIDPAAAARAAAEAAAAQREASRRAAEAATAERERIKRETAERVARENAERRRKAEEEAARFVPGTAPQADTPRYRVKQERMF